MTCLGTLGKGLNSEHCASILCLDTLGKCRNIENGTCRYTSWKWRNIIITPAYMSGYLDEIFKMAPAYLVFIPWANRDIKYALSAYLKEMA